VTLLRLAALTVACESAVGTLAGGVLSSSTSSAISSSISVVSVPFDVTGDGPTISLGLAIVALFGESPPSIGFGLRFDSAERRADLQQHINELNIKKLVSYIQ
jgi:hypothetical protein